MPYAARDDVYAELSAQAFVIAPRPVGAPPSSLAQDFNFSTGIIRLPGNGFTSADIVSLLATSGGAVPGGAAALTPYYPLPGAAGDFFQLAATPNGAPLTFSSLGAGWSILIDAGRRIDKHLVDTAAQIDECLTAEKPPIHRDPVTGLYPQILVGINARMTARLAVTSLQIEVASYRKAVDRLFAQEGVGDKPAPGTDRWYLAQWMRGKP